MAPLPPTRVRLFASCVTDRFFPDAARDAVRLLRALGVAVEVPRDATCCGQPAWNAGHVAPAREMARHTAALFPPDLPTVVVSGSCGAMLRHGYRRMGLGMGLEDDTVPDAWELAPFLVRVLGVTEVGTGLQGMRVAYHHGCHALREGGVREEPLALLRGAGAEVVPWPGGEECCGFGGLFAVKLPWVSAAMADRKLDTLRAGPVPDVLTSADGGCLLQLGGRLRVRGRGSDPRPAVVPLASLLWRAHRDPRLARGTAPGATP